MISNDAGSSISGFGWDDPHVLKFNNLNYIVNKLINIIIFLIGGLSEA